MFHLFTPHFRVHCVWELTPEKLHLWGLRALLLDVDCTLKRYRCEEVFPEVDAWIAQLRAADFRLCLVSNGLAARIELFAERLDLPFVSRAMKPMPWGVWAALKKIDVPPSQTAMVGDQLFTDVAAGRLAGVRCILVDPIHPEEEPWYTRLKRLPERAMLAGAAASPSGEGCMVGVNDCTPKGTVSFSSDENWDSPRHSAQISSRCGKSFRGMKRSV